MLMTGMSHEIKAFIFPYDCSLPIFQTTMLINRNASCLKLLVKYFYLYFTLQFLIINIKF